MHLLDLWRIEFKRAWRRCLTSPGTSVLIVFAVAVATLLNAATFSVLKAVWFELVPYPSPSTLVVVSTAAGLRATATSWPDFDDWRKRSQTLSLGAMTGSTTVEAEPGGSVDVVHASAALIPMLGGRLLAGRALFESDEANGAPRVALVTSDWLSRRRAVARAGIVTPDGLVTPDSIVGSPIRLSDGSGGSDASRSVIATIVGVIEISVRLPQSAASPGIILPLREDDEARACAGCLARGTRRLTVFGRLASVSTLAQSRAEMAGIGRTLAIAYPDSNAQYPDVQVQPVRVHVLGERTSDSLWILQGLALVIAIVTLLNVITFLVTRSLDMSRAAAVQLALGASGWRLFMPRASESAILVFSGGALAVAVLKAAESALVWWLPEALPRRDAIALDRFVIVLVFAACLAVAGIAAVLPAWLDARARGRSLLAQAQSASGRGAGRWVDVLLTAQISMSIGVVFVAALLVKTAIQLSRIDPGFQQDRAVIARLANPASSAGGDAMRRLRIVRSKLLELPHVTAVGGVNPLPFSGRLATQTVTRADGHGQTGSGQTAPLPVLEVVTVTPGYFEAMGIPVLAGRTFNDIDEARSATSATSPIVLNQAAARLVFGDERDVAVGQRLRPARPVIGIVGDTRTRALDQKEGPVLYRLYAGGPLHLVARTRNDDDVVPLIGELQRSAAAFGIETPAPLGEWVRGSVRDERGRAALATAAGGLIVVLAFIGTIGVTNHMTARRRREWAIRMALGAESRNIAWRVVSRVLTPVAAGAASGVLLGFVCGRFVSSALYETAPMEPSMALLAVTIVAAATGIAASWPALRAASVDPASLLKLDEP